MILRTLWLLLCLRLIQFWVWYVATPAIWLWERIWGTGRCDPFGKEAHDRDVPWHSGEYGHYCCDWDGLWICQQCEEFAFCTCFEPNQPPYTGPPLRDFEGSYSEVMPF